MLVIGSIVLAVLGSPLGVLVVMVRQRDLSRRLAALEGDAAMLRGEHEDVADRVAELACFVPGGDGPSATPYRVKGGRARRPPPTPIAKPSTSIDIAPPPFAPPPPLEPRPAPPIVVAPPPSPSPSLSPSLSPSPSPSPSPSLDWERWLGVRGAAALGACVLVVAGLYFFQYSIDRGLLTPPLRVALGLAAGASCLFGSERALAKAHPVLANWLAGAGFALLYTAIWASHALYHLAGTGSAFALMAAVTAGCAALAVRRASLAVAVLGLAGGFATPIALANGEDRPLALFAYLALLDAGLLAIAARKRWPVLAALSLAGTFAYEAGWIGVRMDAGGVPLGLGLAVGFALAFAFAVRPAGDDDGLAKGTRAGALGLGAALGLHVALRPDLADVISGDLGLVAASFGLLVAGASWIARGPGARWIAPGTTIAAVASVGGALAREATTRPTGLAPTLAPIALGGLALVAHGFLELERRRPTEAEEDARLTAAIAAFGGLAALVAVGLGAHASLAWAPLAGAIALGAIGARQATFEGRHALALGVGGALGGALVASHLGHVGDAGAPGPATPVALVVAIGTALGLFAITRPDEGARRLAWHGLGLFALVAALDPLLADGPGAGRLLLTATAAPLALAIVASTALGAGVWALLAMLPAAVAQASWASHGTDARAFATAAIALEAALVVGLVAWPLSARRRVDRPAVAVAVLAPLAWLAPLGTSATVAFGAPSRGVVPAALALTLFAGASVAARRDEDTPAREAVPWLVGGAIGLVTLAVGVRFTNEALTILWAAEGLALAVAFARTRHRGLLAAAGAHLGAVVVRLALNPAVVDYHARPGLPVLNWLAPTYLLPAAALAATALLVERRGREEPDLARVARAFELGAVAVVFAWLNLSIVAATGHGAHIAFDARHVPARDLALSVGWGAYALGLLGLGVARRSTSLRWASLGLVLLTVAKVFLYDLGELGDLFRVASLVGLALSLLAISVAYQRFVLPPRKPAGA
jgi:hypothetical protein